MLSVLFGHEAEAVLMAPIVSLQDASGACSARQKSRDRSQAGGSHHVVLDPLAIQARLERCVCK